MFVFISLAELTQNTKLKSMSSVFMQAIAATVCSRLPISSLLLIVFSEWRLPFAVWWHSYTGRSQPPACSRELARCAHAPSWNEVSILCFCSAWWSLPAPDKVDEWASSSAVKKTIDGPLIYCKYEFGAEKEIFDRLQQMLRYPGTLLFSWRQELGKGNACVPKD
jgi:hypothetical protein